MGADAPAAAGERRVRARLRIVTSVTRNERADSPVARELIAELDAILDPQYPAESRHGYSVDRLLDAGVAFFVVYADEAAAGCGGVELVGREYAELKRMYVRPAFRGTGLGWHLLEHLVEHARAHGLSVVRLETGIHQTEALALYERSGFERIGPFGPYREDPNSVFMERRLE